MSEPPRERAAEVSTDPGEPASTGGTSVPGVAAWQEAADRGAAGQARAAGGVSGGGAAGRAQGPPWTPASAALPTSLRDELVDWLRAALPNEGCGLLIADRPAGDGGAPYRFIGMRNAAASPYRYLMDPQEQLRVFIEVDDRDEVIWGIVHSHVSSPPRPSATDVGLAFDPEALYVLCSFATEPPEVRAWTIVHGAVNEVVLERV